MCKGQATGLVEPGPPATESAPCGLKVCQDKGRVRISRMRKYKIIAFCTILNCHFHAFHRITPNTDRLGRVQRGES